MGSHSKARAVVRWAGQRQQQVALNVALHRGLPQALEEPLRFLFAGKLSHYDLQQVEDVERLRSTLAERNESVDIYYSPEPGSAGDIATVDIRPAHGEIKRFSLKTIAEQTSVDQKVGTFLYLCAKAIRAETALELGACAGIASAYLASGCQRFIGIEGSTSLAKIAQENVTQVRADALIIRGLFDDALDQLLPKLDGIDLAWIDGHHEKVATLHYFQRISLVLKPGAIVLFDDIRWSRDMHNAWTVLAHAKGFSHTIDLGGIGLGIWQGANATPRRWKFTSHPRMRARIGTPHGWSR